MSFGYNASKSKANPFQLKPSPERFANLIPVPEKFFQKILMCFPLYILHYFLYLGTALRRSTQGAQLPFFASTGNRCEHKNLAGTAMMLSCNLPCVEPVALVNGKIIQI